MINNRKRLNWLDGFTLGAPTAPGCYVCAIKLKHFVELKFWDVEDLNANSAKMYGLATGLTAYVDQEGATIYKSLTDYEIIAHRYISDFSGCPLENIE